MQKIAGPGATPLGEFTEGNPGTGTDATMVTAPWMNTVQRELVNLVEAAGLVLNPSDDTQVRQAIAILGAGSGGLSKNLLINGGFEFQQRVLTAGTFAITNAGRYALDRWRCRADAQGSGTGTATVTRQAFTTGQVDVPGNPKNYMRWVQGTSSSVASPVFEQRVEDVTRFGEGSIALSMYLKGSTALALTLRIYQVFGTGGSPTAPILVGTLPISISTAWTRYTLPVNLTNGGFSMAGRTLGTNKDSYLLCEVSLPNGTNGWTVEVANAQLERNSQASTFIPRDPGDELARCQRYYHRSGSLDYALDQTAVLCSPIMNWEHNTLNQIINSTCGRRFPAVMRKAPTVTWWSGVSGLVNKVYWGADRNFVANYGVTEQALGRVETDAGPSPDGSTQNHYEADAEL